MIASRLLAGAFCFFVASGLVLIFTKTGSLGASLAAIVMGAAAVGIFTGILTDVWSGGGDEE